MKKRYSMRRIFFIILFLLLVTGLLFMIATPSLLRSRMSVTTARNYQHGFGCGGIGFTDEEYSTMIQPKMDTDDFDYTPENSFKNVTENPVSTFSIDVDTASYSIIRTFLQSNRKPPVDAVRIEEMINYFHYDYPQPLAPDPFSITTEIASCPWNRENKLLLIGLKGKEVENHEVLPSNLVFLVDSSGSMKAENKLPLLKKAFSLLLDNLGPQDSISIVSYAGSAGMVLPATPADRKKKILRALNSLKAGGSTAGGDGIQLAYESAAANFVENGNNRVILATDGDFNVGVSSTGELVRLIKEKQKSGIYLTICGFGTGNLKDGRMEQISNAGNGNYYYIDTETEAKKVFGTDMRGTLFTIAKDVKIQIEFNPLKLSAYRLIGYENRVMAREDFDDDLKDAGELGAGHSVTALYEICLSDSTTKETGESDLKYQDSSPSEYAFRTEEVATVKLRYKHIDEKDSRLIEQPIIDDRMTDRERSDNFRFASAVAGFGMILRDSKYKGNFSCENVRELAESASDNDDYGFRNEFIVLLGLFEQLKSSEPIERRFHEPERGKRCQFIFRRLKMSELELWGLPDLCTILIDRIQNTNHNRGNQKVLLLFSLD